LLSGVILPYQNMQDKGFYTLKIHFGNYSRSYAPGK
jgi:hypothetical protein